MFYSQCDLILMIIQTPSTVILTHILTHLALMNYNVNKPEIETESGVESFASHFLGHK